MIFSMRHWLLLLLVIFPILIVNLTYNIQSLNADLVITSTSTQNTVVSSATTATGLAYIPTGSVSPSDSFYIYLATGVIFLVTLLVYRALKERKKNKSTRMWVYEAAQQGWLSTLVALGFLVLSLFGVMGILGYLLPSLLPSSYAAINLDVGPYLIVPAFATLIGLSGFGLYHFYRIDRSRISMSPQGSDSRLSLERKIEEFKAILDRTVYSLDYGSDYRKAIIQTYRALCSLLEESGIPQDASLTPREFEKMTRQRLGILSNYLHEATALFERARYSDEELSEDNMLSAKRCFRGLSSDIFEQAIEHQKLFSSIVTKNESAS